MNRDVRYLLTLALLVLVSSPSRAQFEAPSGLDFSGLPDPLAGGTQRVGEPVQLSAEIAPATSDRPAFLAITATIAPGYHIYSITQPAGGPGASVIELNPSPDYQLTGEFVSTTAPKSHVDYEIWDGLTIEEHYDSVTWYAPIELAEGVDPAAITITGKTVVQACQENSCELVKPEFTARLGTGDSIATAFLGDQPQTDGDADPAAPDASAGSLVTILGGAFLGGLILNLMPCVLPVIGLKVLSFAEQAGNDRGRVLAMNLAYSAGLMSVFLLLAGLAAFASYGWGELYTHAEFKIGMILLVFSMALSFLGVWEIPIPGFAGAGKANDLQQKEGYAGAFFKGVFTTILATPCSGPLLGAAIGFTLSQPAWMTFAVFGVIGLGMASPYLLIGVFPDLVKWLPKPGMWMETFKQLMGFVLMGTVVFLMWSVEEALYLPLLTTLVAVGFGCWWIGSTPLTASQTKRNTAWLGGVATSIGVGWAAFTLAAPSGHELAWSPYSSVALNTAQQQGQIVLIDFTADWCLTCKLNLKRAINTDRVKAVVEANGVAPLLADWTDENDQIEQKLAELGSRSIPLLAIYPVGQSEPIILRDLISEDQLLEALREAGATVDNSGAESGEVTIPEIEIGEAIAPGAYR